MSPAVDKLLRLLYHIIIISGVHIPLCCLDAQPAQEEKCMNLRDMEAVHDFSGHKYVMKMMEPEGWKRHLSEPTEVVNNFILPRGPRMRDEISDTVYHAGTSMDYHWHHQGYETFEIAAGSVDCVVNGKHFIATAGDLIHVPPHTSHYFIFLEEGTVWRELFQDMDMNGAIFEKGHVHRYYPEFKKDEEFMAMFRGQGRTANREKPVAFSEPPVDHSEVFQCRTPEFAWTTAEGEGYSLKLKVARFETAGVKEIWNCRLKKGLSARFAYPNKDYKLLYVKSGRLELTLDHTRTSPEPQTWIVEGDSIIDIPPYHTYTVRVLEDTELYDYGGDHFLQNCLEDLASVRANAPERVADEASLLKFLRSYSVYCTKLEYQPE